jgi:hypothetical protein
MTSCDCVACVPRIVRPVRDNLARPLSPYLQRHRGEIARAPWEGLPTSHLAARLVAIRASWSRRPRRRRGVVSVVVRHSGSIRPQLMGTASRVHLFVACRDTAAVLADAMDALKGSPRP